MHFNRLLTETHTLRNAFHEILSVLSSSDDHNQQLSFVQLQNYLSAFVEINVRFKSLDMSSKSVSLRANSEPAVDSHRALLVNHHQNLPSRSATSPLPQVADSSSICSNEEPNSIDIGKSWKFANIIHTRFHMSLIASNSKVILCYNNQNHCLHFILITGQFQDEIRWNHDPINDVLW